MANDSTIKAGSWARGLSIHHGLENRRSAAHSACVWRGQRGRSKITDQNRYVSRLTPSQSIFKQTKAQLSDRFPALSAVWSVGSRWRVHPGILRCGVHGQRQRQHVPGIAADGEVVIGEKTTLEDGRRQMHCEVSGLRRRAKTEAEVIQVSRLSVLSAFACGALPPPKPVASLSLAGPTHAPHRRHIAQKPQPVGDIVPGDPEAYGLWASFEIKSCSPEIVTGFAHAGRTIGIAGVAAQTQRGVLFVDSADQSGALYLAVRCV